MTLNQWKVYLESTGYTAISIDESHSRINLITRDVTLYPSGNKTERYNISFFHADEDRVDDLVNALYKYPGSTGYDEPEIINVLPALNLGKFDARHHWRISWEVKN